MCAWASVFSVFAPYLCNTSVLGLDGYTDGCRNGTLFVWVGHWKGGLGGAGVPQGCPPQKVHVPSKKKLLMN